MKKFQALIDSLGCSVGDLVGAVVGAAEVGEVVTEELLHQRMRWGLDNLSNQEEEKEEGKESMELMRSRQRGKTAKTMTMAMTLFGFQHGCVLGLAKQHSLVASTRILF